MKKLILSLIDVAKEKGETDRCDKYWDTYHCLNKMEVVNDKAYGEYCKNKYCIVCNAIRKAMLIKKYIPVVQEWEDPYLVTLRVKSCPASKLRYMMDNCTRAFQQIIDKYRKRDERGRGTKLMGIKSLECNFNATKNYIIPIFILLFLTEKPQ